MKVIENIDKYLIFIIAILCIFISILDFSGALESIPFIYHRISIMSLLCLGLLATYIVIENVRKSKINYKIINEAKSEIIKSIENSSRENERILGLLNDKFSQREVTIQGLFDKIKKDKSIKNTSDLKEFLIEKQTQFYEGQIWDGTRQEYPWDIELTAIDFQGVILYHPRIDGFKLTNRKDVEPYSVVCVKRTGEYFWINKHRSFRLHKIFPYDHFRPLRLTNVYFSEIERLNAIVVCESHINILSYLPKQEK